MRKDKYTGTNTQIAVQTDHAVFDETQKTNRI